MSVYLCSDLHGNFKGFKKLLEKISFNEKCDKIYILGDIVDRGEEGIALLRFIMRLSQSGAASVIKGNHELFLQRYLSGTLSAKQWSAWGGFSTFNELIHLSADAKKQIFDFISTLAHFVELEVAFNFMELEVAHKPCVLTHAGLMADFLVENAGKIDVIASIKKALSFDEFEFLISTDIHYMSKNELKKLDKYLFVGHTPTFKLNGQNYIIKNEFYTDIDSGAGHKGGKVSALRLDDMKEFYV